MAPCHTAACYENACFLQADLTTLSIRGNQIRHYGVGHHLGPRHKLRLDMVQAHKILMLTINPNFCVLYLVHIESLAIKCQTMMGYAVVLLNAGNELCMIGMQSCSSTLLRQFRKEKQARQFNKI